MMRGCQVAAWVLLAGVAVAGCKSDECEGGPAQAQIDVQLSGLAASDVSGVDVTLVINGGTPITHAFSTATPSFVFEFKAQDKPPRSLLIKAVAYQTGKVVGTGETSVTFSGDACNFFTVTVKPGGAADGGPDGPKPDLEPTDGPHPEGVKPDGAADGPADGPKPDTWPPDGPKLDTWPPDAPKPEGMPPTVCVFDDPKSTFDNCLFGP